jgi:hypothetical protein
MGSHMEGSYLVAQLYKQRDQNGNFTGYVLMSPGNQVAKIRSNDQLL